MTRLLLTSQVHFVAHKLASLLGDERFKPGVFITTAIHDKEHKSLDWHLSNREEFKRNNFNYVDYDISGKSEAEIKKDLAQYEIMYVEGGNSFYLLQESQKNNFGNYIKNRVKSGMLYIGTSAGSTIMGPDIEPLRRVEQTIHAPTLKGTKGFGIVDFVILPHWGSEEKWKIYFETRIKHVYQEDYPYIFLSDNQYVEVTDNWYRIIDVTQK